MFKTYKTARKHAERIAHDLVLSPVLIERNGSGPTSDYYIASYAPDGPTRPTVLTSKREVDRYLAKWNKRKLMQIGHGMTRDQAQSEYDRLGQEFDRMRAEARAAYQAGDMDTANDLVFRAGENAFDRELLRVKYHL